MYQCPACDSASLYEMIEKDTPVIAYYREPTELTTENCRISNAFSYVERMRKIPGEAAATAQPVQ